MKVATVTNITVKGNPHMTVLNALYAAFDHFNEYFYAKELLPRPVINIGSAGRMNALGWFLKSGWRDKEDQFHEINMSAEYLRRKPEETLETLLHEMAHMRNEVDGIKDCNQSQYHNKKFKSAAEYLGLKVEKSGYRGWSKTTLDVESKAAIRALPFNYKKVFSISRPPRLRTAPNKYLTVALKKEDWSPVLEHLTETQFKGWTNSEIVKHALQRLSPSMFEDTYKY